MSTLDAEGWDISVCGLNCAVCDIYRGCHGDEEVRAKTIEWFRNELNLEVEPECEGCRGPLSNHWSPDCKMLACAKERGHEHCFECDYFPCEKLEEFGSDGHLHHERTVKNMKIMREIGLDAWIMDQKRRGQCLFCP